MTCEIPYYYIKKFGNKFWILEISGVKQKSMQSPNY